MPKKLPSIPEGYFTHIARKHMGQILGRDPTAVDKMVGRGAPRNEDKTYNTKQFIEWLIMSESDGGSQSETAKLKEDKLKEETEKLHLHNEEKKGHLVPAERLEQILGERARSFSTFIPRCLKENVYELAGKTVEEMIPILDELAIQMMEVYIGKRKGGK